MKNEEFVKELLRVVKVENGNKIPFSFIEEQLKTAKVKHFKLTENTRACVVAMVTGHELVGIARVLDSKNDDEEIGQKVAYKNATDQLWETYGSIAKLFI